MGQRCNFAYISRSDNGCKIFVLTKTLLLPPSQPRWNGKTHPATCRSCPRLADHSSNQEGLLPEAAEDDGAQRCCGQNKRQVKGGGDELSCLHDVDEPPCTLPSAGCATLSFPPSPPPLPEALKASENHTVLKVWSSVGFSAPQEETLVLQPTSSCVSNSPVLVVSSSVLQSYFVGFKIILDRLPFFPPTDRRSRNMSYWKLLTLVLIPFTKSLRTLSTKLVKIKRQRCRCDRSGR